MGPERKVKKKPSTRRRLYLPCIDLAILFRVLDHPGVHAQAVTQRIPRQRRPSTAADPNAYIRNRIVLLVSEGLLRHGKPYRVFDGHNARKPLFVTARGKGELKRHLQDIANIDLGDKL